MKQFKLALLTSTVALGLTVHTMGFASQDFSNNDGGPGLRGVTQQSSGTFDPDSFLAAASNFRYSSAYPNSRTAPQTSSTLDSRSQSKRSTTSASSATSSHVRSSSTTRPSVSAAQAQPSDGSLAGYRASSHARSASMTTRTTTTRATAFPSSLSATTDANQERPFSVYSSSSTASRPSSMSRSAASIQDPRSLEQGEGVSTKSSQKNPYISKGLEDGLSKTAQAFETLAQMVRDQIDDNRNLKKELRAATRKARTENLEAEPRAEETLDAIYKKLASVLNRENNGDEITEDLLKRVVERALSDGVSGSFSTSQQIDTSFVAPHELERLQARVAAAEMDIDSKDCRISELETALRESADSRIQQGRRISEDQRRAVATATQSLQQEITSLRQQLLAFEQQPLQPANDSSVLAEQVKNLTEQLEYKTQDYNDIRETLGTVRKEADEHKYRGETFERRSKELEKYVGELRQNFERRLAEAETTTNAEIDRLSKDRNELQTQKTAFEEQLISLQRSTAQTQAESLATIQDLKGRLEDLLSKETTERKEKTQLQESVTRLTGERNQARLDLTTLTAQLSKRDTELTRQKEEVGRLTARVAELLSQQQSSAKQPYSKTTVFADLDGDSQIESLASSTIRTVASTSSAASTATVPSSTPRMGMQPAESGTPSNGAKTALSLLSLASTPTTPAAAASSAASAAATPATTSADGNDGMGSAMKRVDSSSSIASTASKRGMLASVKAVVFGGSKSDLTHERDETQEQAYVQALQAVAQDNGAKKKSYRSNVDPVYNELKKFGYKAERLGAKGGEKNYYRLVHNGVTKLEVNKSTWVITEVSNWTE